jgi:hypothetical protein
VACPTWRLMPSSDGRSPREDTRSSWRSSPSCKPEALSFALTLSVLHGCGITCQRGCRSLLYHTEMAGEVTALQMAVSSAMEFVLEHSLDETFRVEVVDELIAKIWKLEEWRSRLERSGVRICDLLVGSPSGPAQLAYHLDEAAGQLGAELAKWREVDIELEDLQISAARVQDLMLDREDGSSSLTASLSIAAELLEGLVDVVTTNKVRWGTRSALVDTLSHFPELEAELEILRFGRNTALMEDQVDALWILACPATDLLASHILPSVARGTVDGAGE